MSIPELDKLKALAKTIVYEAKKNGLLGKTSNRMVREEIESRLSLEHKALDAPEYRKPLKEAVEAYIDTIEEEELQTNGHADDDDDDEEGQVSPKTNRLSKPKTNVVEEEEDYVEDEEEDEGKAKRKKASSKKSKEQPETERPSKKRKSGKENGKDASNSSKKISEKSEGKNKANDKFKSAEFIPSSDAEDDAAMQVDSTGKIQSEDLSSADEGTSTLKPSSSKAKSSTPKGKTSKVNSEPGPHKDEDSDTGLSDLIDEPPKKKSKSKNATKASGKKKEKASNKKELSKDEETIKRLKGFINACGVRKVWSKLFDGIEDQPSKQIKMLRKMLEDLGMEGRPSMEKAKAIRAKRELENELAEVQAFEKAVSKQGTRSSKTGKEAEESEESASEEAEENERPAKRKTNARQSIMAFLADQSDSE